MSKEDILAEAWAIIDSLAHLVNLLIAERHRLQNAPPEEGGWIRTDNTAYRPPKASGVPKPPLSEKHAQIGSIRVKNPDDGRGKNHPGTNRCSVCGKPGRNRLTCGASFRSEPGPGWVRNDWNDSQMRYTNQAHRRSGD